MFCRSFFLRTLTLSPLQTSGQALTVPFHTMAEQTSVQESRCQADSPLSNPLPSPHQATILDPDPDLASAAILSLVIPCWRLMQTLRHAQVYS